MTFSHILALEQLLVFNGCCLLAQFTHRTPLQVGQALA